MNASHIPTTGRRPTFQAKQLGFNSVEQFANSLLPHAVVVDVGAGLSRFGHQVARRRPDIRWINIDPSYIDSAIHTEVNRNRPQNLIILPADITKKLPLVPEFIKGADLVYSYWMLPHMSLENTHPATAAIGTMYDLLKPDGKLIIGPVKQLGIGLFSPFRYRGTVSYSRENSRTDVIADAVKATRLWWLPRTVQAFSNRHNLHLGMYLVGGKAK